MQHKKTHTQIGSGCGEDQWLLCYIMMRRLLEVDTLAEIENYASRVATDQLLPRCYVGFDYNATATEICKDMLKPFERIVDIHNSDLFRIQSYCTTLTAATTATVGPVFMVCGLLFVIGGGVTEAYIFDGPGNYHHFKEMIKKHMIGPYGLLDYYRGTSHGVLQQIRTIKSALNKTRAAQSREEQERLQDSELDSENAFVDKFMDSWICTDSAGEYDIDDKRDLWVLYVKSFVAWAYRYLRADGPLDSHDCELVTYTEKQEYTMKLLRAYGRYICEGDFRRIIDTVYVGKVFNSHQSNIQPLQLPGDFDRFCFKNGQRPECSIETILTSPEVALVGYGEEGPNPLLIKEAYRDFSIHSNRQWRSPRAQKNAAAIFANWFFHKMETPWLIKELDDDFNRMRGDGWRESWIWPQSTNLLEKGVDIKIGMLFLAEGDNFFVDDENEDNENAEDEADSVTAPVTANVPTVPVNEPLPLSRSGSPTAPSPEDQGNTVDVLVAADNMAPESLPASRYDIESPNNRKRQCRREHGQTPSPTRRDSDGSRSITSAGNNTGSNKRKR